MEHLGLPYVLGPAIGLGLPGIILVLWYFGDKARERELKAYREDTQKILTTYKDDVQAIKAMYESNVALVKTYESLAGSLKDIVVLNTQAITRQCDLIINNQYCPNIRLKKDSPGVVG